MRVHGSLVFTHDASATTQYQGPSRPMGAPTLNAIASAKGCCLIVGSNIAFFDTENNASCENNATRVVVVLTRDLWRSRSASHAHGLPTLPNLGEPCSYMRLL
jgi:hypothetical protein